MTPIRNFEAAYPGLTANRYDLEHLDLDEALDGAALVIVHEWNDPSLVRRIGEHRRRVGGYRLFFHDTHHRIVTAPETMAAYELRSYDGVLAYGKVLQEQRRPAYPGVARVRRPGIDQRQKGHCLSQGPKLLGHLVGDVA